MSEYFYIRPRANGVGFIILWGPTHICEVFGPEEAARQLCDILEALRQVDADGADPDRIVAAWHAFSDSRNRGRH